MDPPFLLTPGPSNVPPRVLAALSRPAIHHRSAEFAPIFQACCEGLQYVFRTQNPVVTFAGSGTLAMEAAVAGVLSPGDKVITLETGKFGERWGELSRAFGMKVVTLNAEWGQAIDLADVESTLSSHPDVEAVYATLCETSTGVLTDLERLGAIVAKTNAILVVDAVSGLAADRMETDAWRIDIAIGASQKALMLPPGLAFASASAKARKLIDRASCPVYYASLKTALEHLAKGRTPFTSAVSLMSGLAESLAMVREEGIENVWSRHKRLADSLRAGGERLGLMQFSKAPSNAVVPFFVPPGIAYRDLSRLMREDHGLTIAGGQGKLEGKIFRIAAMGWAGDHTVERALTALESSLRKLGHTIPATIASTNPQGAIA